MTLNTEIIITPLARVKILPHFVFQDVYRVAILTSQSFQSCNKSLINQACSRPKTVTLAMLILYTSRTHGPIGALLSDSFLFEGNVKMIFF